MAKQKFNNLPKELTDKPRWISVNENKIPITEKWQHPENQKYVSDIQAPLKGFDISGHGVDDDYLVLDFDHVFTDNGEWVNAEAERVYTWITSSAPTYIERSISKTGFHMLYKPTKGTFETINSNKDNNIYFIEGNKDSKIEFFYKTAGRQFVLTGDCEGLCKEQSEIASGETVDSFLKELVAYSHSLKNKVTNKEFTAPSNSAQSNSFELNAQNANLWVEDVLNLINVEQLNRPEWVNTGTSLKQLGISFDVFNRWSSQDTGLTSDGKKNRYDESDCWYQWNSFKDTGDTNAAVGQLINLAREYDPDGFKNVWHELQDLDLKRKADKTAELLRKSKEKPAQGETYKRRDSLMNGKWDTYIETNKELNVRKTGFNFMDMEEERLQDFKPGCYLIGAIPSAGKTTFCYQLGEQLAEHGTPVLFVSCEMNEEALLLKSVSRRAKLINDKTSLKNRDIRNGGTSAAVKNAISALKNDESPFYTYYAKHSIEIEKLVTVMNAFCADFKDKKPVVIIDYLQYLQTEKNFANDKQKIDYAARVIKDFVEDNPSATAIVISSFNRAAYRSDVSMESFKETGGIEYFADVVWGLQYDVFEGRESNTDKKGVNIAELVEAKKSNPRKMMIRCIKNRFGGDYSVHFDYYSAQDLFRERDNDDDDWGKEDEQNRVGAIRKRK